MTEPATFTCSRCRFIGKAVAFDPALRQQGRFCCLECAGAFPAATTSWLWGWVTAVVFLAATSLILVPAGGRDGWPPLTALFYLLLGAPLSALHEFGHLVAAKLAGLDVTAITLGRGRPLWTGRVCGVYLALCRDFPIGGGEIFAGTSDPRWMRSRRWLFIFGGPAANALLLLGCVAVFGLLPPARMSSWSECLVFALVVANLMMLFTNLWPRRGRGNFGPVRSDGWWLGTIPFAKPATVDSWIEAYFAASSIIARRFRDRPAAIAWCRRGLDRLPHSFNLLYCQAVHLIGEERDIEAQALLEDLLARPDITDTQALTVKNSIAYSIFQAADPGRIEVADRYSSDAVDAIPFSPYFAGTRGAVLLTLGRTAEALPLLEKALKKHTEDWALANVSAMLAMAHADLGELPRAAAWAAKAKSLDRECLLLPRAAARIEAAAPARVS
jgi:tetratricopeptide (TPR) repeat protein